MATNDLSFTALRTITVTNADTGTVTIKRHGDGSISITDESGKVTVAHSNNIAMKVLFDALEDNAYAGS